jgi:hypothetical protein
LGYYYDWINKRWLERTDKPPRRPSRLVPRPTLLNGLLEEMEKGDSQSKLYAGLLPPRPPKPPPPRPPKPPPPPPAA